MLYLKQYPVVLFLAISGFALTLVSPAHAEPRVIPGQYLIKYKKSANLTTRERRVMKRYLGVDKVKDLKLTGAELVKSTTGQELDDQYAKELLASGLVDYIEPDYEITVNATPNDNRYGELWGLHNTGQTGGTTDVDVDAPEAWDLTTGSDTVVVGVVDTGVNYNHEDLQANSWVNPREIAGNGIDDDGNGVIDDVHGYNAVSNNGDPMDDNGHGSHCAGTISGVGNNSKGVAGVNWNVKIMGLKFLTASGSGATSDAIETIEYAVNAKAAGVNIKVLSNSWGGGGFSQALEDAIVAANQAGIIFIAAAGNSAENNDTTGSYPANYTTDNVVSVAAIDHDGNLASFSNYGATSVDIAAPGVSILSVNFSGGYTKLSGTSMATPHVAGVAALVLGREPNLTTAQLKERILATAKPLEQLAGQMVYPGTVSALRALSDTRAALPPAPVLKEYDTSTTTYAYDTDLGTRVLNQDDGYKEVSLGISFPFYGESFSRVAVSGNGRIIPLEDGENLPSSPDFSNSMNSVGILPFHDDVLPSPHSPSEQGIWFKSDSSSATFTYVVIAYANRNTNNPANELRVQVKLFTNGKIEFHYLDSDAADVGVSYGASASVGLTPVNSVNGQTSTVTHNEAKESEIGSGKALKFQLQGSAVSSDYDGDGTSDMIIWRPSNATWYIATSSSNFAASQIQSHQLGLAGDIPLTGDYDGDGRVDLAVWRPADGTWYFRTSASNYAVITATQWGFSGDTPVAADYDGDGINDLAVYRVSTGQFFVLLSSAGFNRDAAIAGDTAAFLTIVLGGPANDVVVGDFTGNGKDDFTTIWQLVRFWQIADTAGNLVSSLPWGAPGDTPLGCDQDGDGIDERIVARINSGNLFEWYGVHLDGRVDVDTFASLGDKPICKYDFDGDGKSDLTAFRPHSGEWFVKYSGSDDVGSFQFGLQGDILP